MIVLCITLLLCTFVGGERERATTTHVQRCDTLKDAPPIIGQRWDVTQLSIFGIIRESSLCDLRLWDMASKVSSVPVGLANIPPTSCSQIHLCQFELRIANGLVRFHMMWTWHYFTCNAWHGIAFRKVLQKKSRATVRNWLMMLMKCELNPGNPGVQADPRDDTTQKNITLAIFSLFFFWDVAICENPSALNSPLLCWRLRYPPNLTRFYYA